VKRIIVARNNSCNVLARIVNAVAARRGVILMNPIERGSWTS